jgi:hypothetical protein
LFPPHPWHSSTRTSNFDPSVLLPTLLQLVFCLPASTDKLAQQQDLSSREVSLLQRKLGALLAAGGPELVALESELSEALASPRPGPGSTPDDHHLLLRLRDLQQQHRQHHSHHQQEVSKAAASGAGKHGGDTRGASDRAGGTEMPQPLSPEGLLSSALEDAEAAIALLQVSPRLSLSWWLGWLIEAHSLEQTTGVICSTVD